MLRQFNKQPKTVFSLATSPFSTTSIDLSSPQTSPHEFSVVSSLINFLFKARKSLQSLLLFKNVSSFATSSNFDHSVVPSLIRSCIQISQLDHGKCLHGYLLKCGFVSWFDVNTSLIDLYVDFGRNVDARKVFDEMPVRDGRYFDFVVCAFWFAGLFEEVVVVFEEMVALGFVPSVESVRRVVVACGELRRLEKGRWVHEFVVQNDFEKSVVICNTVISMYVKMNRLDLARSTFDAMENRDLVSWNTLIIGYAQKGNWAEALNVYQVMKECGNVVHNNVTFLGLAFACGQGGNLDLGQSVHGHCVRAGLLSDFRLSTAILDMYAKCGNIDCAEMLFDDDIFEKSLVSWNSLISNYSKAGYYHKAVNLFKTMSKCSSLRPDSFTLANVIPAFSSLKCTEGIGSIHALILKKGLDMGADVVLGTAMVDAYGKCSNVAGAEHLFSGIKGADTPTWNAMLTSYYLNKNADKGMLLLLKMLQSQISPDTITIVLLLQMCGQLGSLNLVSMAHGYGFTKGFASHLKVENTLLDMYMRCRSVENAELLFALMNVKSIVTWNTMLSAYVKIASYSRTMRVLSQMLLESGHRPDPVTLISLIQASSALLSGYGADVAHAFVLKLGFNSETVVVNSLIDSYVKNGSIYNASSIFSNMGQTRDRWSWNVMISGCGMNGQGEKACELLDQMIEDGQEPDSITFTALLSTCSHSGMIDKGCMYFDLMVNTYKIQPDLEHWTCIIDMLGRAGRLEDAHKLITCNLHYDLPGVIPLDSHAIWGAFMDACRMYKSLELGELAGRKLLQLSPKNSGYPILLSNLYASTMRWDEAAKARQVLNDGSLAKEPGLSSVN